MVATERSLSVRNVRRNCLECSGDSPKYVIWCPCDGVNSTRCEFWPFRFGIQPATFRQRYGDRLLAPELMPAHAVDLDALPTGIVEAATAAIDLPGYKVEAVELPELSPEEEQRRAQRAARLRHAVG